MVIAKKQFCVLSQRLWTCVCMFVCACEQLLPDSGWSNRAHWRLTIESDHFHGTEAQTIPNLLFRGRFPVLVKADDSLTSQNGTDFVLKWHLCQSKSRPRNQTTTVKRTHYFALEWISVPSVRVCVCVCACTYMNLLPFFHPKKEQMTATYPTPWSCRSRREFFIRFLSFLWHGASYPRVACHRRVWHCGRIYRRHWLTRASTPHDTIFTPATRSVALFLFYRLVEIFTPTVFNCQFPVKHEIGCFLSLLEAGLLAGSAKYLGSS